MTRGSRRFARIAVAIAAAVAALLGSPGVHAAVPAVLGTGTDAKVAVDGAGTAHVGWRDEDADNAILYCGVPRGSRACAAPPLRLVANDGAPATGVLTAVEIPSPGAVEVLWADSPVTYLARSTDGGRTFAPGYPVLGAGTVRAARTGDGRYGFAGQAVVLQGGAARADGADAEQGVADLAAEFAAGGNPDVAALGGEVFVMGGDDTTRTYRLPAGTPGSDPAQWALLPEQSGRGRIAAGPSGVVSILQQDRSGLRQAIVAQRLENGVWNPSATVEPRGQLIAGLELDQDSSGRLTAVWSMERDAEALYYATSADGGAQWSAPALVAPLESRLVELDVDGAPDGGATIVTSGFAGNGSVALTRIDPGRVPVATARIGDAVIQASATCRGARDVGVGVTASRAGRQIPVRSVLRRARFDSRTARRRANDRFSARFRLRRTSAVIRVRIDPRARGEANRTVRLRALTCRGRL